MTSWDPNYEMHNLLIKLARRQRIATIAAGVKSAHPAMYHIDVIRMAQSMEEELSQHEEQRFGGFSD